MVKTIYSNLHAKAKSEHKKNQKKGKELEFYLGLAPNTGRDNMVATSGRDGG
jgi:hypothetical protein